MLKVVKCAYFERIILQNFTDQILNIYKSFEIFERVEIFWKKVVEKFTMKNIKMLHLAFLSSFFSSSLLMNFLVHYEMWYNAEQLILF